jgi:hypothetical protein
MEKLNSNEPSLCKTLNGWTWGNMELKENSLKMYSKDKEWFNIPGSQIMNLTNPNKNELGMEFIQDEDMKDE